MGSGAQLDGGALAQRDLLCLERVAARRIGLRSAPGVRDRDRGAATEVSHGAKVAVPDEVSLALSSGVPGSGRTAYRILTSSFGEVKEPTERLAGHAQRLREQSGRFRV